MMQGGLYASFSSLELEPPVETSPSFTIPNEFRNEVFEGVLKGKNGALISVGALRTRQDAVMGEFSYVRTVDGWITEHPAVIIKRGAFFSSVKEFKPRTRRAKEVRRSSFRLQKQ